MVGKCGVLDSSQRPHVWGNYGLFWLISLSYGGKQKFGIKWGWSLVFRNDPPYSRPVE